MISVRFSMKAVIDTSSLISLVRYYLPFDKDGKLKSFLERQILSKSILVLDRVVEECEYQGKGQVMNALPYLKTTKFKTDTSTEIASPKFHRLIDNNFINGSEKNRLSDAEYQIERDEFINSADLALILYAFNRKESDPVIIITEETGFNNDGKVFKKIPEICKSIGITTKTLPEYIYENNLIDLDIDLVPTTLF